MAEPTDLSEPSPIQRVPKGASRKQLRRWLRTARELLALERARHEIPPPRPPIGTLVIAGLAAEITAVHFADGAMVVTAVLPLAVTGMIGGRWHVLALDGSVCYSSKTASPPGYFGVKTTSATWEMTFACDLREMDGTWPTIEQAQENWAAREALRATGAAAQMTG